MAARGLTERALEVLQVKADNLDASEQDIADMLGLGRTTVHTHLVVIREALGVKSTLKAIIKAAQMGWIDLPDLREEIA